MKDLMLDIETLCNEPQGIITTIAAVAFDRETGETGVEFIKHITIQDSLDKGLKVNGSTIVWWMQQSEEARNIFIKGQENSIKLEHALYEFNLFMQSLGSVCVWGNGVRFDVGLLHDSYIAIKKGIPWRHVLERDVRTIVEFAPEIKKRWVEEFQGVKHNAIDDCKNQIGYITEILNKIKI